MRLVSDELRILPDAPLPQRLVDADALSDEYRRLRSDIARRPQSGPVSLRVALEGLSEDEGVGAVDPLSRRQRHSRADKEAYARHLREHMTPAEWVLWEILEGWHSDGIEVRAQEIVQGWIVDFYLPAIRLVVEVDGAVHNAGPQWQRDRHKDAVLARSGYTVMRLRNSEVMANAQHCADRILERMVETTHAR